MIGDKKKLKKARALVAQGWCKGHSYMFPDKYCASGAIRKVAGGNPYRPSDEAYRLTEFVAGPGHYALSMINDHPLTTHQDVLAAFDAAIAQAGLLGSLRRLWKRLTGASVA